MANLKEIAKGLVIRSRAGDQNASAMIMEVAKSAAKGSQRAIESNKCISQYIKSNPVPVPKISFSADWNEAMNGYITELQSNFSGEAVHALVPRLGRRGAVSLANGKKLTNDIIRKIGSQFGSEKEAHAFYFAINNSDKNIKKNASKLEPRLAFALILGCEVGIAKRIQLVRLPNIPISILSKEAARELGDL